MADKAYVALIPMCDFHPEHAAVYDGKTIDGPWANMCEDAFRRYGVGLGTGLGQRYIVGEKPKAKPSLREIADMSYDELDDLVGDGDLLDWI